MRGKRNHRAQSTLPENRNSRRTKNSRKQPTLSSSPGVRSVIPAKLLRPAGRFFRSTEIERDFLDSSSLEGVIITPIIAEMLQRIVGGARSGSSQRAWRITGDYGTGKSTAALLLARILAPRSNIGRAHPLPDGLPKTDIEDAPSLWPVLVVGDRVSLAQALCRGLAASLNRSRPVSKNRDSGKRVAALAGKAAKLETDATLSGERVVSLFEETSKALAETRLANGLLLVVDELGKFLEFAAGHSSDSDVYLLQSLAESATRSSDIPIVIVGLLHQGVESYAEGLPRTSQREWAKVAGRFAEIVFTNGVASVAQLMAGALRPIASEVPASARAALKEGMRLALDNKWFGTTVEPAPLLRLAQHLYPVHPTVVPVLCALARRFAQNERTVLSFTVAGEPFSVSDWARHRRAGSSLYRLSDLFDYLRAIGGVSLDDFSRRAYWPRLLAAVDAVDGEASDARIVMKTVAVLNLVESDGFSSTETAVVSATQGQVGNVPDLLRQLVKSHGLLHDRGRSAGFAAWPHTSVDLGAAMRTADEALSGVDILKSISDVLPSRPIVAKRHYIERGTLRHFPISYLHSDELESALDRASTEASDGLIHVVLVRNADERSRTASIASGPVAARRPEIIVGISEPLEGLADAAYAVERWRYVLANTPELGFDTFAKDEARRSLVAAEQALVDRARVAAGLAPGGEVRWFRAGREVGKGVGRLSVLASDACDELYPSAPRVANELLNRRALSSASAAARMRLIERILVHADKPNLDLPEDGMPPEKSMYLSVFKAGRLHLDVGTRSDEPGSWVIRPPNRDEDPLLFEPVFTFLHRILAEAPSRRVNVNDVIQALSRPPYGVREGLVPVLLAALVAGDEGEIAFYERETFLRAVNGAVFMRLIKDPKQFDIQLHAVDDLHRLLYRQVSSALRQIASGVTSRKKAGVVDVVRELCEFAVSLPDYTRRTSSVSMSASRVRNSLFQARDPVHLLCSELPSCVGLDQLLVSGFSRVEVESFVAALTDALQSLRDAYPQLLKRMTRVAAEAFGIGTEVNLRQRLAERVTKLGEAITDLRLRGLCLRLSDGKLSDEAWIESLGSFALEKPPKRWTDDDEVAFSAEVSALGSRLMRVEAAKAVHAGAVHEDSLRLICTTPDGNEVAVVAHVSREDDAKVAALVQRFTDAAGIVDELAIAALARVLTAYAERRDSRPGSTSRLANPK